MTIDTAKLRAETLALIDGTTPGPWRMDAVDPARINGGDRRSVGAAHRCGRFVGPDPVQAANARLIAATPTLATDTLRLLDEIERLTAENERMRAHPPKEAPMTANPDLSPEAVAQLADDCILASKALHDTGTFETGQAILGEAAAALRALLDEIERLTAENEKRMADLAEMTRRRDQWREKAAGNDALRAAVRAGIEKAGTRDLSRAFLRGALVESERSLAEARAKLIRLRAERDAAWKAGAEAMRKAAVGATGKLIEASREHEDLGGRREGLRDASDAIRALPIPKMEGK